MASLQIFDLPVCQRIFAIEGALCSLSSWPCQDVVCEFPDGLCTVLLDILLVLHSLLAMYYEKISCID